MGFTSIEEVFRYIESFTNLERSGSLFGPRTYRLDRMQILLESFGRPQLAYRTLHIAGTKGKGSTACLAAWALHEAGRRTGLYTSPHVVSYLERMEVLGEEQNLPLLLRLAGEVRAAVQGLPPQVVENFGGPNTFELLTLLGFLYFREMACTDVVVEVGIGGRLDATNLVAPVACLITPIELEHTDVLGPTLEAIATEKAGIIKPGVPVFSAAQAAEVRPVLRRVAAARGSEILFLDEELESLDTTLGRAETRLRLHLRGEAPVRYTLRLLGDYQAENAALAHLALRRALDLPGEALSRGFARATLPGRLERIGSQPPVLLDGAHTPRSVERLAESFRRLYLGPEGSPGRGVLLFAAAAGKRIEAMAGILAPMFPDIVITTPGSFRESEPRRVFEAFLALNPATILEVNPGRALELALDRAGGEPTERAGQIGGHRPPHRGKGLHRGGQARPPGRAWRPVLVTGSFYLVGEIRRLLLARHASIDTHPASGL
jgi:dihydrofolate synthase/folylpolyglutamate synthase